MFVWYHFLKIHESVLLLLAFKHMYATQRRYKSYRKKNYLMKYTCFLPQKPDRMLRLLPGFEEELLDLSFCKSAEHFFFTQWLAQRTTIQCHYFLSHSIDLARLWFLIFHATTLHRLKPNVLSLCSKLPVMQILIDLADFIGHLTEFTGFTLNLPQKKQKQNLVNFLFVTKWN